MLTRRFLIGNVAVLVFASGWNCGLKSAYSCQRTNPDHSVVKKMRFNRFVKRFDTDSDGVLRIDELPPPAQVVLEKADTDGDGALSLKEYSVLRSLRTLNHFASADENGDGALQPDETEAGDWLRVGRADKNRDGAVTLGEIRKTREGLVSRITKQKVSGLTRPSAKHKKRKGPARARRF